MGKTTEFTLPSTDGVHDLHVTLWEPEGEARAVVQIIHGISEYVGRYAPFARYLNDHGYAVVGHDHLGHGYTARDKSEYGRFPEEDGWFTVNRDVRLLRRWAGERFSGLPYFLFGHSMGSFQARTYLIDYPGTVDGCILSGTGQESAPVVAGGKGVCALLWRLKGSSYVSKLVYALSLGAYNGKFRPNRTAADWISRDKEVVDAYVKDPMCRFVPTVGMFHAMMTGLQYIGSGDNVKRMDKTIPIALFSGASDPVGAMGKGVEKVYRLLKGAGCANVTMKLYPDARHEILHELNREEVFADLLAWLEDRI